MSRDDEASATGGQHQEHVPGAPSVATLDPNAANEAAALLCSVSAEAMVLGSALESAGYPQRRWTVSDVVLRELARDLPKPTLATLLERLSHLSNVTGPAWLAGDGSAPTTFPAEVAAVGSAIRPLRALSLRQRMNPRAQQSARRLERALADPTVGRHLDALAQALRDLNQLAPPATSATSATPSADDAAFASISETAEDASRVRAGPSSGAVAAPPATRVVPVLAPAPDSAPVVTANAAAPDASVSRHAAPTTPPAAAASANIAGDDSPPEDGASTQSAPVPDAMLTPASEALAVAEGAPPDAPSPFEQLAAEDAAGEPAPTLAPPGATGDPAEQRPQASTAPTASDAESNGDSDVTVQSTSQSGWPPTPSAPLAPHAVDARRSMQESGLLDAPTLPDMPVVMAPGPVAGRVPRIARGPLASNPSASPDGVTQDLFVASRAPRLDRLGPPAPPPLAPPTWPAPAPSRSPRRPPRRWYGALIALAAVLIVACSAATLLWALSLTAGGTTPGLAGTAAAGTSRQVASTHPVPTHVPPHVPPTSTPTISPPVLAVNPTSVRIPCPSSGSAATLTLSDTGGQTVHWQLNNPPPLLFFSAYRGSVGPGASSTIQVRALWTAKSPRTLVFDSDGGNVAVSYTVTCH